MWIRLKKCFTLVEVLVALAVSSIAITAAYSSYQLVADQYAKNTDLSDMHATGRSIIAIIKRDIRMAGFEYRDDNGVKVNGGIPNPLVIKDSGNTCCDSAEIIYDYYDEYSKKLERRKISYYTKSYSNNKGNRNRLYKKVDILDKSNAVIRTGSEQPMADFIEDFQLVNFTGGNYVFTTDYETVYKYDENGKLISSFKLPYQTHTKATMLVAPDGLMYYVGGGRLIAINPETNTASAVLPHPYRNGYSGYWPWFGMNGNKLYLRYKSDIWTYDVSQKRLEKLKSTSQASSFENEYFNHIVDTNSNGLRCKIVGYQYNLTCYRPDGSSYPVSLYNGIYGTAGGIPVQFQNSGNVLVFSRNYINLVNPITDTLVMSIKTPYEIDTAVQLDQTKKSALVDISIIVRSKNKHSIQNKQFTKKSYLPGNFSMTKNDRYEREFFHSSVVARNMAL